MDSLLHVNILQELFNLLIRFCEVPILYMALLGQNGESLDTLSLSLCPAPLTSGFDPYCELDANSSILDPITKLFTLTSTTAPPCCRACRVKWDTKCIPLKFRMIARSLL